MDVVAARGAVIGHFDRFAGFFGREDLQVRSDYGLVAVERDVRKSGEMCDPAGDGLPVRGALHDRRDRLIARGAGEIDAAIEYAVLGVDRFSIIIGAGVGARWVAGDEIVDFEPVLDSADALFEATVFAPHFLSGFLRHVLRHVLRYVLGHWDSTPPLLIQRLRCLTLSWMGAAGRRGGLCRRATSGKGSDGNCCAAQDAKICHRWRATRRIYGGNT